MTKLPTLYARTQTNAIQQWTVIIDGDQYQTEYGQVGGKIQTTNWTKCLPTNEGRANARTAQEQAHTEAQSLWTKKKDSGYFEQIEDVDNQIFFEPMLAKKFEDYKDSLSFPVFSQIKMDGLRCVIRKNGMFSRNGKEYVSCPHIREALNGFFELYPTAVLDGELYNHALKHDFNKITSLVKKTKPTMADKEESKQTVEFWVYDLIGITEPYKNRNISLQELFRSVITDPCIRLVETTEVWDQEELDELFGKYLEQGFEGQMVRLNGKYENKRSKSLLKRKEFQDEEYVILDIIEGVGNKQGMAGAMTFKTEQGILFNSNIKGTREFLTEIWRDKNSLIGKQATVKFFNKTPEKEIPRFPYVIKIRCEQDLN